MRLEILPRTELALRVLRALADGARRRAADIGEQLDISADSVAQLVMPLARSGWVRSRPGPTGGYELAVALTEISVLDLIEALEGVPAPDRCVMADRPCPAPEPCAMHDAWVPARGRMLEQLANTSLEAVTADNVSEEAAS